MPAENTKLKHTILNPKRKDEIKADPRWSNLTRTMHGTWQQIGSDVLECCGGRMKNAEAIEAVLDANYMSTNCGEDGQAAEDFVTELDKLYGAKAVEKFLNAEVRLN